MNFYELRGPDYQSDQASDAANPLTELDSLIMPGLTCSACGSTWAGNRKLYLSIPKEASHLTLENRPLKTEEWQRLAEAVRKELYLAPNFLLMPGDRLGAPHYQFNRTKLRDFLHPFPGRVLVNQPVLDVLQDAAFTGFAATRIDAEWSKRIKGALPEMPAYYALSALTSAWHIGVTLEGITTCGYCGRFKPPVMDWHSFDERTWDGSDFFLLDSNDNRIVVTERVCETLSVHRFTNWICD